MEGKISGSRAQKVLASILILILWLALPRAAFGQQSSMESAPEERPQLELRRSVERREYQGKTVEGEERAVAPGDSLWRILIREKGLPEKRFGYYMVIIHGLNPHLKALDSLRVGDTIFIPLRLDEVARIPPQTSSGESSAKAPPSIANTHTYRVKRGDHLLQILREQLGVRDHKEVRTLYARVKDLNPQRKNWDLLQVGEVIRLPLGGQASEVITQAPQQPAPEVIALDDARRLPARENLGLLAEVLEALGNEVQRSGQETLPLKEGTVRIDRNTYPVIFNPKLDQKIILDPDDKIPSALRAQLESQVGSTRVVSIRKGASLEEFINHALPRLGYQTLPADQPVVIKDGGIGYEVKGSWIVMAPEESHKPQEIFIINLSDNSAAIPEYLKEVLAVKGINLKDILVPSASTSQAPSDNHHGLVEAKVAVKTWPREKKEMIDAILETYGVSFSSSQDISVELHEGLRLEARSDRLFEFNGQKVALFFSRVTEDIKRALREKHGTKAVEFDLASLPVREVISRVLRELGDQAIYHEHRFPAASGANKDKLLVTAWGFLLPRKKLFITDREIPQGVLRFFFERGLQIVYF